MRSRIITAPATMDEESPLRTYLTQPRLTAEQIEKIDWLLLLTNKGIDMVLDDSITHALGMTTAGQTITVHQVTARDKHKIQYAYNRIPGRTDILLAMEETDRTIHLYRLNSEFRLIAAVFKKPDNTLVVIPVPQAQEELNHNLMFWAALADKTYKPSSDLRGL